MITLGRMTEVSVLTAQVRTDAEQWTSTTNNYTTLKLYYCDATLFSTKIFSKEPAQMSRMLMTHIYSIN